MSKNTPAKVSVDVSRFCKSSFTITFAVEVVGIDVWHDCNEGWLDLGPCSQGFKIHYSLYPGKTFEVDILIWPHAAKVWAGTQYGWVRTWQFLERRFIAFSVRHAYPVRVKELRSFMATITPSVGIGSLSTSAKNDRNTEVYLPALNFGEKRYFATIIDSEERLEDFLVNLIWELVVKYIPSSFLDGLFDVPQPVTDVRHQDAIIFQVREAILNGKKNSEEVEPEERVIPKMKGRRESRTIKETEKGKKKQPEKSHVKYEIKLPGDAILAGIGRIVPFEKEGDRPHDLGEIIAIISSCNLPAQDDIPIIFVNVETLTDIPVDALKKLRISQIYTRWIIGEVMHDSKSKNITSIDKDVKFDDHHALAIDPGVVAKVTAEFLDAPFEIQLRGICLTSKCKDSPKFFGYQKSDHKFGKIPLRKVADEDGDTDVLIAVTKIDGRSISKGVNHFLRGEYPLFPPPVGVPKLERGSICTNDINLIKVPFPNSVVPSYLILEAQMNLEVSIGFVGCEPKMLTDCFSRLYCLIKDNDCILAILKMITETNDELLEAHKQNDVLTGFGLDAGSIFVLYIEGPKKGLILRVWEKTQDFYPKVKPVFSTSDRFSTRIYSELLLTTMPFCVLKMYAPLGVLLACPPIYASPALPLPTRSAILKLDRLIAGQLRTAPSRCDMPSASELDSFRLELCVPVKKMGKNSTCRKMNAVTLGQNQRN